MSIPASRSSRSPDDGAPRSAGRIGLAPDALSVALILVGIATSLGAASIGGGPGRTEQARTDEARLSAYERASWERSAEGGGLTSLLSFGHLLGPMLVLAGVFHARARHRELTESLRTESEDESLLLGSDADQPCTLRRLSIVVPRAEADTLLARLALRPEHAHRALSPLSSAIERAGALEHVELVIDGDSHDALERERHALEQRLCGEGLGSGLAGYRDVESVPAVLAGEHVIVSWVLVTRAARDPLLDVPTHGRTADWLGELLPARPEATVALEAFVTPRHCGADARVLARVLSLDPLRGRPRRVA